MISFIRDERSPSPHASPSAHRQTYRRPQESKRTQRRWRRHRHSRLDPKLGLHRARGVPAGGEGLGTPPAASVTSLPGTRPGSPQADGPNPSVGPSCTGVAAVCMGLGALGGSCRDASGAHGWTVRVGLAALNVSCAGPGASAPPVTVLVPKLVALAILEARSLSVRGAMRLCLPAQAQLKISSEANSVGWMWSQKSFLGGQGHEDITR